MTIKPEDLIITATSPTADELQDYIDAWLSDAIAADKINRLCLIGRTLGIDGEKYKYSGRTPPKRYRVGDVCLHYSASVYITGTNRTIHGAFENIIVTVGGDAPFELIDGTRKVDVFQGQVFNELGKPSKTVPPELEAETRFNFYLPGDWEDVLLPEFKTATKKIAAIKADQNDIRRRELLERIGLS